MLANGFADEGQPDEAEAGELLGDDTPRVEGVAQDDVAEHRQHHRQQERREQRLDRLEHPRQQRRCAHGASRWRRGAALVYRFTVPIYLTARDRVFPFDLLDVLDLLAQLLDRDFHVDRDRRHLD
jgi:hypothetical protein